MWMKRGERWVGGWVYREEGDEEETTKHNVYK